MITKSSLTRDTIGACLHFLLNNKEFKKPEKYKHFSYTTAAQSKKLLLVSILRNINNLLKYFYEVKLRLLQVTKRPKYSTI